MKDPIKYLSDLNITVERHEHPPVFTVEEADRIVGDLSGGRNKNLFLRNKKGDQHYLVTILDKKRADLKRIAEILGTDRLSFASPDRMMKYLGLTPGSVSPFGLINDTEKQVKVLLDADLMDHERLQFHPNDNTATVIISRDDFSRFLDSTGHELTTERL